MNTMPKVKNTGFLKSHRPSTRRLIQLYSALLHNAHLRGFIDGEIYQGKAKYACIPGLNCYSCPGAVGACPLGALQNALASAGHRAGWYILGILLLFGTMLGRTVCGWLCPAGLIQELLHKIPTLKIRKNRITRFLTYLKYVILGYFVIAIPLWYGLKHDLPVPGFCKYICPAGTLEGAAGLLSNPGNDDLFAFLGLLFTRKAVILVIIGLACIFCYRSFCRFLCPLGAVYGLFNRFCLLGVKVDAHRCSGCGNCVRHCEMDVRQVGDHECISCARCMAVCHEKAISLKAGTITLKAPEGDLFAGKAGEAHSERAREKRKRAAGIAWGIALAVLCAALIWFNLPNSTGSFENTESESFDSTAPEGYEEGMQLEDFTITCLDGSEFHLADTHGKVTFINLWATYCEPCVRELPLFNDLVLEHKDDIAVLAVHSSLVIDDPEEMLAGREWAFPFAVDTSDDKIWGIVGGSSTMPQTIVLNRRGEVIFNRKGSVTAEMLAELYNAANARRI